MAPEAQKDLDDILSHIAEDLENPQAAQSTVRKIMESICSRYAILIERTAGAAVHTGNPVFEGRRGQWIFLYPVSYPNVI